MANIRLSELLYLGQRHKSSRGRLGWPEFLLNRLYPV